MNRDRGTIKWNAMMLPEHVKLLREWKAEDSYEPIPEIDEWALQEVAEQLQRAWSGHGFVELAYWRAGEIITERGYVQQLQRENVLFQARLIPFAHLIRVTVLSEE